LRRAAKGRMPFVRRREYRILQRRFDGLTDAVSAGCLGADRVCTTQLKPPSAALREDVCLFVTHAPHPVLKLHVIEHASALVDAGVSVLMVVNTDLPHASIEIPPSLLDRLDGCMIRDNLGFDFAGWAHLRHLLTGVPERLMMINDSIVGPTDPASFAKLMARVRASAADVIGLTENSSPRQHLQSFFLVFTRKAQESAQFRRVFDTLICLPTKELVIEVFETRLTQHLTTAGLQCAALFPALTSNVRHTNDTQWRWEALVRAGFPYVKASVIKTSNDIDALRRYLPERFLTDIRG